MKASPINLAWAEEMVSARGLAGPLAKDIAAFVASKLAAEFQKKFPPAKVSKLLRAGIAATI
jgi:hypothetical protein